MAVNGTIQLAYQNSAWFTANASVVLLVGQIVYLEQTGTYKIGDGVTALSALSFLGGSSTTPTLQEVTDEGASTTNAINAPQYSTSGGEVTITTGMVEVLDSTSSSQLLYVNRTTDLVKYKNNEVATVNDLASYLPLAGGSLSGALNEAKGANIASATTTDIGAATGNLIHITGTTTITSFGTVQAGTERTLVFDGALTITHNATSLILPNGYNILTAVNDIAVFVSEGIGNWRLKSYQLANDGWITYSPTLTGFSVNPAGFTGKYKLIGKTCFVSIYNPAGNGTSNATTTTVTVPFNAATFGVCSFLFCVNNTSTGGFGTGLTTAGSNVVDVFLNTNTAWTASNGKRINGNFAYEIQ